jgi:type I restriction enzyme M protein
LGEAIVEAMNAIGKEFPPLAGVLPKDYTIFERTVLEDLLKIFNREALRRAGGDLFGRIYEYFLREFSIQQAIDKGEFFTPPSLVQTIVNVIEPDHGIVLDPACGSGGMFVQYSYFIERHGQDTAQRVTFYGQEKTATTIKVAQRKQKETRLISDFAIQLHRGKAGAVHGARRVLPKCPGRREVCGSHR